MQNNIENMLCRTRLISLHMMLPVTAVMLLLSGVVVDATWPPMMAKPGCRDKCGNVTIPFPFGMGSRCYYNEWYSITCGNFTPTLAKFDLQVLSISLDSKELLVDSQLSFNCTSGNSTWTSTDFSGSPYTFSINNVFAPVHCPATILSNGNGGGKLVAKCTQVCDLNGLTVPLDTEESVCLVNPPYPLKVYSVNFTQNGSTCSYVFLGQGDYLDNFGNADYGSIGLNGTRIPVVLDWVLEYLPDSSSDKYNPNDNPNCISYEEDGTYSCECQSAQGFGGNPYLPNGCQHDPECDGCNGECSVDGDDWTRVTCIPSTKSKSRTHLVGVVIDTMQNNIENMLDRTRLVSLHMMLPVIAAVIVLLSGVVVDATWPPMMAKPGCRDKCGNVTIPYPFGMGPSCYCTEWYSITCDNFTPTLSKFGLQVLQISLGSKKVRVDSQLSFNCTSGNSTWTSTDFSGSPYTFSTDNVFAPVHCPVTALSNGGDKLMAQCGSVCDLNDGNTQSLGTKESVCLTNIPYSLNVYSVNFTRNSSICSYVFLVDGIYLDNFLARDEYPGTFTLSQPQKSVESTGRNGTRIPVVLDWHYEYIPGSSSDNYNPNCISSEDGIYSCECQSGKGFGGNPYLPNGCQHDPECDGCGECFVNGDDLTRVSCDPSTMSSTLLVVVIIGLTYGIGSLFLAPVCYWQRCLLKRSKEIKKRAQNFKRNGGLLLQQQISSTKGVVEKALVFTVSELEVATDHFNQNRILGQGGQGTVYKGMLADGKIIAVKKSRKVDENQLAPFINEVVILSQINHRNVVKLLGCCLETDVPLLVYEFIPNGTLSEHIHNPSEDFRISWPMRLQIASESAGAIAYLHSSCSAPIYHRDIKSSNILLDEKYRAKVSDFGTSRTILIDQTHLTTQVAGTFGYFDPEYFISNQFTDKSDVYSFGVVLVELLTSRRPISSPDEFKEWRSLSFDFLGVMEKSQLLDILDGQILKEGKMEEFLALANLAKACLNTCGKQRPTMKQVAIILEGLRSKNGDPSTQQTFPELNQMNADVNEIETPPSNSSMFSAGHGDSFINTV